VCSEALAEWDGPVNILVNNAGIMALPELQRTAEGLEMQFATNFLGHFALATGLHEALAAASDDASRVDLVERQYDGACLLRQSALSI
jgi:NAD(P)-dependent dehydrogenase (short-subunit alcohol dehydrogenase family)